MNVFYDNIFDAVDNILIDKTTNIINNEDEKEYDDEKFDSYIVKPESLDNQILYGIIDLFEQKFSVYKVDLISTNNKNAPDMYDKIMQSLYIAYITEENIPVAACTLKDPNIPDHYGVIIRDYVELKTGYDLENRLEQEFFEIHPDYHDLGLSKELRRLIKLVADKTFIIVPENDIDTIIGLKKGGYKMVTTFKKINENTNYQLWID